MPDNDLPVPVTVFTKLSLPEMLVETEAVAADAERAFGHLNAQQLSETCFHYQKLLSARISARLLWNSPQLQWGAMPPKASTIIKSSAGNRSEVFIDDYRRKH